MGERGEASIQTYALGTEFPHWPTAGLAVPAVPGAALVGLTSDVLAMMAVAPLDSNYSSIR